MRALEALKLGALFSFVLLGACRGYPPRPVVSEVVIEPGEVIDVDALLDRLATVETPYLFGIFPRVLEYETYDPSVLARDLERIERAYRGRGYYEAKVTAARVVHTDEHHVRVEIRVDEGRPVKVVSVDPQGLSALPLDGSTRASDVTLAIKLKPGDIFDETRFEDDKKAAERALRTQGHAFAKVEGRAQVDIARHAVRVTYQITPGPAATYGPITVTGLKEIPEGPVRDALDLTPGKPYSAAEVEDAERALVNLGVFARVEIREDLQRPEGGIVPLTVVVEESKLRTVRLGGGTRLDVLRLRFHLRASWEDENFLGGMRKLSVEGKPGITLFPTSIERRQAPVRLLPEFRARTKLEQPSLFEARTKGFVSADYAVYPVLYPLPEDADPERESILGYHEIKASTGVERHSFMHKLFWSPSYNWQAYFPIYYQGDHRLDADGENVLQQVRVSFPALSSRLVIDSPTVSFSLANEVEVAGYWFQGTVSDVKVRPELRTFLHNAFGRRTTLAFRSTFGFLFPGDYGESFDTTFAEGDVAPDATAPAVIRDQQKMLIRGFYSGGPTSNRGYPLRGVGPHGPVGFLIPQGTASVDCSNSGIENWQQLCRRPLGGMTLWELSLEGRFPISGNWRGVVFIDASDLTPYPVGGGAGQAFRFSVPHLSPGVGLRYQTPVGPLRLDVAYRVPGAQEIGQRELSPEYGSPSGAEDDNWFNNYYLPISLHLAIGEAFD
jgi:hypothetical protein